MKFVFVIYSLRKGGAEKILAQVSNYLIDHINHCDVIIITISNDDIDYFLDSRIKIQKLGLATESSSVLSALINMFRRVFVMRRLFKEILPTHIISFMTTTNILVLLASVFNKVHLTICERISPEFSYGKFWEICKFVLYRLADQLVVQTKGAKDYYQKRSYNKKILVIENALNHPVTNRVVLNSLPNVVLNIGRLVLEKRHEFLINEFIRSKISDHYILHIYGEGPERGSLENFIRRNNLSEKVVLMGHASCIDDVIVNYPIFVSASKVEGFPNALLEAMSYGLICLSTDCSFGPKDLIVDGWNGYLMGLGPGEITKKLDFVELNRSHLDGVGENAFKVNLDFAQSCINEKWVKALTGK